PEGPSEQTIPQELCPTLFYNKTARPLDYTLSLHDALPIFARPMQRLHRPGIRPPAVQDLAHEISLREVPVVDVRDFELAPPGGPDRKSTRLNSSHLVISYAVFCLKKKTNIRRYSISRRAVS